MAVNSADLFVLAPAFSVFVFFLILHILLLRINKNFSADRAISWSLGLGILIQLIILFAAKVAPAPSVASVLIYILLVFHYLVWVFGMGEAAIRIRLLRELDQLPFKSASLAEICVRYNAEKILQSRLERLVGAGHLKFDGRYYSLNKKILLVQVRVETIVKALLGIPKRC